MSSELIERHKGFTPGPWAIDSRVPTRVTAAGDFGICSTGGYQCNFMDPEKLNAQHEANARLVADAPALLAALEAAASRERGLERDAKRNAAIADVVLRFIDRMCDICDEDPAERILTEFTQTVIPIFDAAMAGEE